MRAILERPHFNFWLIPFLRTKRSLQHTLRYTGTLRPVIMFCYSGTTTGIARSRLLYGAVQRWRCLLPQNSPAGHGLYLISDTTFRQIYSPFTPFAYCPTELIVLPFTLWFGRCYINLLRAKYPFYSPCLLRKLPVILSFSLKFLPANLRRLRLHGVTLLTKAGFL